MYLLVLYILLCYYPFAFGECAINALIIYLLIEDNRKYIALCAILWSLSSQVLVFICYLIYRALLKKRLNEETNPPIFVEICNNKDAMNVENALNAKMRANNTILWSLTLLAEILIYIAIFTNGALLIFAFCFIIEYIIVKLMCVNRIVPPYICEIHAFIKSLRPRLYVGETKFTYIIHTFKIPFLQADNNFTNKREKTLDELKELFSFANTSRKQRLLAELIVRATEFLGTNTDTWNSNQMQYIEEELKQLLQPSNEDILKGSSGLLHVMNVMEELHDGTRSVTFVKLSAVVTKLLKNATKLSPISQMEIPNGMVLMAGIERLIICKTPTNKQMLRQQNNTVTKMDTKESLSKEVLEIGRGSLVNEYILDLSGHLERGLFVSRNLKLRFISIHERLSACAGKPCITLNGPIKIEKVVPISTQQIAEEYKEEPGYIESMDAFRKIYDTTTNARIERHEQKSKYLFVSPDNSCFGPCVYELMVVEGSVVSEVRTHKP